MLSLPVMVVLCSICLLFLFRHTTCLLLWLTDSVWRRSDTKVPLGPRLSKYPSLIRPVYDVIVVGSGYGGGVAASRMARSGKSVCLLERGAEKWPGEYPHTLKTALQNHRMEDRRPGKFSSSGKASSLYQTFKGDGQDVFSGCGLGGTSLINAGVFLRADKRVFEGQDWPVEIREHSRDLIAYYERGERMFRPRPYPHNLPKPRKLSAFEDQVHDLGFQKNFYKPPLTTSFENGLNNAGVQVGRSTASGNECTGVNDGSKNSVLVTYLSDAWTWGAEIFCGVEVRHIRETENNEGYVVYYEIDDRKTGNKRLMWARAKELVILSAGALGTTEVLLRSREYGLSSSPLLGKKLSGNGDLLAFAYNCDRSVNSVGRETPFSPQNERCGTTITGCIDLRGKAEAPLVENGFVIQDGAIPEALAPVIQAMLETKTRKDWSPMRQTTGRMIARMKSWIFGPYHTSGSVDRTAIYLVMSHDENEGTMEIKDNKPTLQWSGIGAEIRRRKIQDVLSLAAASIGGTLLDAPHITVHPLGGACMSGDNTGFGGVVNHMGQLYRGLNQEVYTGIICMDASIIPTSLGVNPCATITALAERSCNIIIRERDWIVDERSNGPLDFSAEPCTSLPPSLDLQIKDEQIRLNKKLNGLRFDEILEGFIRVTSVNCDFEAASTIASTASSSAQLSITVSLHRFDNGLYTGFPTGTFSCGVLSQDPLLITQGSVDFFTVDADVSDAVNLVYNLKLLSTTGEAYNLYGTKRIDSSIAFSVSKTWTAATMLYTTISRTDGSLVAKGILRLSPWNFIAELMSLQCDRKVSIARSAYAKAKFLRFFACNMLAYLLSPFRPLQYPSPGNIVHLSGHMEKPKSEEVWIQAADGAQFCIKKWEPSPLVVPRDTPIMLIPGASVDDQIFSLPTISTNTIDYFTSCGYRCYVPILRFGAGNAARHGWTVFDARLDVKAALQYIRAQEDNKKIYAIVHCLGSIATAISLLNGDVEASWFCGMTCSQVFTNLLHSKDNDFKARHQCLITVYRAIAGDWLSCRSSPSATWTQYVLDQLLRFYPVGKTQEMCNSAVCHRCDVPFGRCWNHANLNHATHALLGEFFDGIHMSFLTHLSRMGANSPQHVRTNLPEFVDLVTSDNLQRLAGLKINLLSGGDNAVWQPNATKKSLDMFRQAFPHGSYARVVVQGYGHMDCWIGKDACTDVYPRIKHHVEFCDLSPMGMMHTELFTRDEEGGYVKITRQANSHGQAWHKL